MSLLCTQCPRKCAVDRMETVGFCGVPKTLRLARAALHPWEEPCLCGEVGSGALFFCGCNLRCVFCQNRDVSRNSVGREVTPDQLLELMKELVEEGAANLNLVTPTQYARELIPVLQQARRLSVPIVYNSGGYESVDTLRDLEGLVDIYLPDCKYFSPALSSSYSSAPDYFSVASDALSEMLRQVGPPRFGEDGRLLSGVMVRHLVLPACRQDSISLLQALAERFGSDAFLLSLMSQYTPAFASKDAPPSLHRRLTTFEYTSVLEEARRLGFSGYLQEPSSASSAYTPDFSLPLILPSEKPPQK